MRTLAEFVMRSRTHALLVTVMSVATVLFCWVGAAVVALTLWRQGTKEALIIALWAAAFLVTMGEVAPLAVLVTTVVAAHTLKVSNSWAFALFVSSLLMVLAGVVTVLLEPSWVGAVQAQMQAFIEQFQQSGQLGDNALKLPGVSQIVSTLFMMGALGVNICLMLGRSMHASLDKPGGFQQEFHNLRIPVGMALLLAVVALALVVIERTWLLWACVVAMPLFFSGLGLVHQRLAARNAGGGSYIFLYLFLVLVNPAAIVVAALGFIDSWMDLRKRISGSSDN